MVPGAEKSGQLINKSSEEYSSPIARSVRVCVFGCVCVCFCSKNRVAAGLKKATAGSERERESECEKYQKTDDVRQCAKEAFEACFLIGKQMGKLFRKCSEKWRNSLPDSCLSEYVLSLKITICKRNRLHAV